MRNERLTYVDTENGAFKEVRIYETYVVKSAKGSDVNYLSYSEARYDSRFHDEDGEFHPSWVDDYNDQCTNRSDGENQEEMQNEYSFMKTFGHLPIITPILWGDEYEYAMPKVKTYDELGARPYNEEKQEQFYKKVMLKVAIRVNRSNLKVSSSFISRNSRLKNIVETGYRGGLSVEKTARDTFYFVLLDHMRGLTGDMHSGNLGIYRGHIVTFDTGRAYTENIHERNRIRRRGMAYDVRHRFEVSKNQSDLQNLALRAKYDKLSLKLIDKRDREVIYVKVDKVVPLHDTIMIKDKSNSRFYLDNYEVELAI